MTATLKLAKNERISKKRVSFRVAVYFKCSLLNKMPLTFQQRLDLNPLWQWQEYFDNMGAVGLKDSVINCNHPGYIPYGPLPVDPISPRRYNPSGELFYIRPNYYDPLGNIQPVPKYAPRLPITCCNYYGVCQSRNKFPC